MILGVLFILVSFLLGLSLSALLSYPFYRLERALIAFVMGHAVSIWITFIFAVLLGSLNSVSILLSIAICAVISIVLLVVTKTAGNWDLATLKQNWSASLRGDKPALAFFCVFLLYVLFMNWYGVFHPYASRSWYAFLSVWGDYPWHTSLITSFAYSNTFTFPVEDPWFPGTQMHYPFIFDFYSAILMKLGFALWSSILVPNICFQLALFGLLYYLTVRMTDSKAAGIGATALFIFAGFPAGLQELNIHFLNPMYAVIIPQRTAIIGLAVSLVVYLLLYHALFSVRGLGTRNTGERYKEVFAAGALIGLLPYVHAHSFMATGYVALCLVGFILLTRKDWITPSFFFLPLLLLALPQVLQIRSGISEEFFVFFPGWADTTRGMIMSFDWSSGAASLSSAVKSTLLLEMFWALNAGGLFILFAFGFLKAKDEHRIFAVPFLLLFVLANLVKFQPWYFDNYKLLIHWLLLTCTVAPLAFLWVREFQGRTKTVVAVVLAAVLFGSTIFGLVTHASMLEQRYVIWPEEEIALAAWVCENTPPDTLFLTSTSHNHPIPSLTGRARVMGYEGWLWTHGIPRTSMNARKADVKAMYKGDYSLLQEYGVDCICIGPHERNFAKENNFDLNESSFEDERRFELIYDEELSGAQWRIYKVKTPTMLEVSANDTTIVLTDNRSISEIPDKPYVIESTEAEIVNPFNGVVRVSPETQMVSAGNSFGVNIIVEAVTDMAADGAVLHFDPLAMQANDVTAGVISTFPIEQIDNTAGTVTFAYAFASGVFNGSGTLASVEFATNASATDTFNLTLTDVELLRPNGSAIQIEVFNGTVTLSPLTIAITLPVNRTYASLCVKLNFIVEPEGKELDWIGYSLDGGANVTITRNTTVSGLSAGNHTIVVYATDALGNTVASDTTVHFTVHPADIDFDGRVWVLDNLLMAQAYGSRPGDPRWNPDADLTCDDWVYIEDNLILAQNYGTVY